MQACAEQLELFNRITRLTWKEGIPIYHELEGRFKPGNSIEYEYRQIETYLGKMFLDLTTFVDIKNYRQSRMLDGVKDSTINREHSRITRIVNAYSEWKGLGRVGSYDFAPLELPLRNPGELVAKADERPFTRTLVLTPMELYRFCDYAHPRVRVIVVLALMTLLRRKNLELLDKNSFNSALQQLHLTQSKTKVPITLPVNQTVRLVIDETKYNCVCDFTNFRRLFERARKESGVNFWMTDLRRTGATQMLLDGIDLRTIQRYLGHTTLVMTERYLQPPVQNMIEASRKIEQKFAPAIELMGLCHSFVGENRP